MAPFVAIAQTKAASSRAMATQTTLTGFPAFAGPEAVLAYLARYTHRVAISNSRLIKLDEAGVAFRWKDYRIKGRDRAQDHDARRPRVHPPLSHARAGERLPPHPPLRPVRQRRSHAKR